MLELIAFASLSVAQIATPKYGPSNFEKVSRYLKSHQVGVVCNYDLDETYTATYSSKDYCNGVPIKVCFAKIRCVSQKTGKSVDSFSLNCAVPSGKCPAKVSDCAREQKFQDEVTGTAAIEDALSQPDQQIRVGR